MSKGSEISLGRLPSEMRTEVDTWYIRLGISIANWAERWWPDAFSFVLIAVLFVFVAVLSTGTSFNQAVEYYGSSFWALIPFTLQTALVIIAGYVLAVSPPIYRIIKALADIPKTPRGAVAFVAFFALLTSLLSWGLSLIFSGFLIRELAARVKGMDYRAAGAAGYLGLGATWALGLSSSAALLMNTKNSIPAGLLQISGTIPLNQTLFTWQSLVMLVVISVVSIAIAYCTAPTGSRARTAESLGVDNSFLKLGSDVKSAGNDTYRPGEWFERTPFLPIAISALGFCYLYQVFSSRGVLAALNLNVYNFMFLMLGLLLHGRLNSFLVAVKNAVPATAGILVQYAFYAGIFGLLTKSSLSDQLAHFFVDVSTHDSFPLLAGIYSGILGFFIPSGGGKWILEAPYLLTAATELKVHLGWIVQTYNAAEALPNLINPFWMLPLLGVIGIRARDIVGYSIIQFFVHVPLALFLIWALAHTFEFVPPVLN